MLKRAVLLLALAATLAMPFLLRPKRPAAGRADDTVVILTPHNGAIRDEFGAAFQKWHRARTGRTVLVDWRNVGGTAEIARYLDGEYTAAFRNYWTGRLGRRWSAAVEADFARDRPPADPEGARAAFLASDAGCGADLFFGGGAYDFARQAAAGRLVPSRIVTTHPEWFCDAVFPREFAGEPLRDPQGRWFGDALSGFGIISNPDPLARLGLARPPAQWADLADPRLFGEVALADPTMSGSIAAAFENIIQQQMRLRLAALRAAEPGAEPKALEARAVREGWVAGLRLIQLMGANARYFTDSAQKPPIDVSQGDCAAGVCIDFYGRYQEEAVRRRAGAARIEYHAPPGGTAYSADPIGLLRGAPHRDTAEEFIEFVLSPEGQKLWGFKVGAPGGPERFALRRLPLRRDFYAHREWRALRSDPDDSPYAQTDALVYRPDWTEGVFREMAFVLRVMCIDPHPELARAWRAVIAAGRPPQAMAALQDMSAVDYARAGGAIRRALESKNKADEIRLAGELGSWFRANYARAEKLADEGK